MITDYITAEDRANARAVCAPDPKKGALLIGGTVLLIEAPMDEGYVYAAFLADCLNGKFDKPGEAA